MFATGDAQLGMGGVAAGIDPARMSRVLINLMSNASEAMVGKGVDPAKFAVKEPRISIASSATVRGFEISVADNGPGIAPENLDKVFEPLFTTKSFGTGLGIPAVQKIMEQHGGGLEVRSAPGQGAEFIAWWPRELPVQVAA